MQTYTVCSICASCDALDVFTCANKIFLRPPQIYDLTGAGVTGREQGDMGGSAQRREGWPGVPRKRGTSFWGFTGGDPP